MFACTYGLLYSIERAKMKKIVICLLTCLTANIQCMEQPEPNDTGSQLGDFDNWPDELIVYLFSFVPKCTSMEEVFKTLAQLSLVNSTFKQIAEDPLLLKALAKRYIEFYPLEAEKKFCDAVANILKDTRAEACLEMVTGDSTLKNDRTKEHTKIVIALALVLVEI